MIMGKLRPGLRSGIVWIINGTNESNWSICPCVHPIKNLTGSIVAAETPGDRRPCCPVGEPSPWSPRMDHGSEWTAEDPLGWTSIWGTSNTADEQMDHSGGSSI